MNEVSIIINGVRYDAVEDTPSYSYSSNCDLYDQINGCQNCLIGIHACARLIGVGGIFKKSDKKFTKKYK